MSDLTEANGLHTMRWDFEKEYRMNIDKWWTETIFCWIFARSRFDIYNNSKSYLGVECLFICMEDQSYYQDKAYLNSVTVEPANIHSFLIYYLCYNKEYWRNEYSSIRKKNIESQKRSNFSVIDIITLQI